MFSQLCLNIYRHPALLIIKNSWWKNIFSRRQLYRCLCENDIFLTPNCTVLTHSIVHFDEKICFRYGFSKYLVFRKMCSKGFFYFLFCTVWHRYDAAGWIALGLHSTCYWDEPVAFLEMQGKNNQPDYPSKTDHNKKLKHNKEVSGQKRRAGYWEHSDWFTFFS